MSGAVPVFSESAANQEKVEPFRQKVAERGIKHLINGEWVASASGETFQTLSPVDNSVIAEVASGSEEDIDKAAKAAAEAFKTWRNVNPKERKRLLHRVADLIEDRAEEIALLEVLDTGQTIRFMSKAATRAAQNFRFFADRCESATGRLEPPHRRAPQLHHPPTHRSGGHHHPLEHALHALDLEDGSGFSCWLHHRSQARRVEPGDGVLIV